MVTGEASCLGEVPSRAPRLREGYGDALSFIMLVAAIQKAHPASFHAGKFSLLSWSLATQILMYGNVR